MALLPEEEGAPAGVNGGSNHLGSGIAGGGGKTSNKKDNKSRRGCKAENKPRHEDLYDAVNPPPKVPDMVRFLVRRSTYLTAWEKSFIDSIGYSLSPKQHRILKQIYVKVCRSKQSIDVI